MEVISSRIIVATEKKLIIRASNEGTMNYVVGAIFWGAIFAIIAFKSWSSLNTMLEAIYAKIGQDVGYFEALVRTNFDQRLGLSSLTLIFGSSFLLLILAACRFVNTLYWAKTISVINLDKKRITHRSHEFPFQFSEFDCRFDRVIEIVVQQTSLQKLLNIGAIKLKLLRHENFESQKLSWDIEYLSDPIGQKRRLERLLSEGGTEAMQIARHS